ncbi:DNA topoisomerase 2-like [Triticum dicoccoides]|uniref:DNA topoisomerase 2-like n=1 Tax=Triticum dicoccoides TaxID=85692 RepID=UPI00188DDA56|nr:DNA topoisomerase 2-like [Triticum dicoccoides]
MLVHVFYENMGKKLEPKIKKCEQSENWTRVTFKPVLAKYNMTELDNDVVALMRKRVVDMAGTLGKTVKVELNGQKVVAKSFSEYVQLYTYSASKVPALPRETYVVRLRHFLWIRGGTHVDYLADQIANYLTGIVNRTNKCANMKLDTAKGYLWVFINALIEDPAFDSPTKETLITPQRSFGSKCELCEYFLGRVASVGVVGKLLSLAEYKLSKEANLDPLPHSSTPMQHMQAPPRPTQIFSEIHGVHHRETKKRDHDDVFLERYLKLKREEIDRFAAIEERKLEDPCNITKCITTIEKLQGLQVGDILVAADIFKSKKNREAVKMEWNTAGQRVHVVVGTKDAEDTISMNRCVKRAVVPGKIAEMSKPGEMVVASGWNYSCNKYKIIPGDLLILKMLGLGFNVEIYTIGTSIICRLRCTNRTTTKVT